jgi:hypothetical protein
MIFSTACYSPLPPQDGMLRSSTFPLDFTELLYPGRGGSRPEFHPRVSQTPLPPCRAFLSPTSLQLPSRLFQHQESSTAGCCMVNNCEEIGSGQPATPDRGTGVRGPGSRVRPPEVRHRRPCARHPVYANRRPRTTSSNVARHRPDPPTSAG